MKREAEIQRRLRAVESLLEAVSAMKSISAHHLRETRRGLIPARRYREEIDTAVAWAGVRLPSRQSGATGLLVIGAEIGLCGGYNSRLAEQAVQARHDLGDGPTFCVGRRLALMLQRHGCAASATYATPTGTAGITEVLLGLSDDILGLYFEGSLQRVDLVAAKFEGVGVFTAASTRLVPIDVAPPAPNRHRYEYVSADHLSEVALRELLYIQLYEQILEALASEHGARLVATQAAEKWLSERCDRLRRNLASARREASTQETLEIAGSARAHKRRAEAGESRTPG